MRVEGYAVISLSGGDPLAYPQLGEIVARSQALGFRVTMVSNGLLAVERMDPVLSRLDSIAISFDGLAPRTTRYADDLTRSNALASRWSGWPHGTSGRGGNLADPRRDSRVA